jgi:hypothetical protein
MLHTAGSTSDRTFIIYGSIEHPCDFIASDCRPRAASFEAAKVVMRRE